MQHDIQPWEEISRESVFRKYNRGVDRVVFKLPNGKEEEYYLKNEQSVIATVAITKEKKFILAKQFRPGPKQIFYELPGGHIEEGENPAVAAERELREETGYVGKVTVLGHYYPDAYTMQQRYIGVALDCEPTGIQELDHTEDISIELVTLEEFVALAKAGKMSDMAHAFYVLHHLGLQ